MKRRKFDQIESNKRSKGWLTLKLKEEIISEIKFISIADTNNSQPKLKTAPNDFLLSPLTVL